MHRITLQCLAKRLFSSLLDLIWGAWNENIFGKSEIRLDTPVNQPPDGKSRRL